MAFDWGSLAAGIGSSLASSAGNSLFTYGFNKRYFDYTRTRLQGDQQNMIRQSPSLMVQGLKNAGLNPASLESGYEGGVSSPGMSSGVQPNFDPLGKYVELRQLKQSQDLTDANVNKLNAEAEKAKAETNEIHENAEQQRKLQASQEILNKTLSKAGEQGILNDLQRLQNETDLTYSKIGEIEQNIMNLNTENQINVRRFGYIDQLLTAQIYNLQTQGKLNSANAAKAYSDIQVNDENIKYIQKKCNLTDEQVLNLSAYTGLLNENTSREHFDNQVRLMVGYDKYKQLEENKMLGVMYDNALTIQNIRNGETDRRVKALTGAVDNVLNVGTFGAKNFFQAPQPKGYNQIKINYNRKGDYMGHTETSFRNQF